MPSNFPYEADRMKDRNHAAEPVAWKSHENHVAALYRQLGYTVTPDIQVDGQQVDLVCEKWIPGAGRSCLFVDCKHTTRKENTSVSKDDVDRFLYSFRSRALPNGWTAAVMVSNRSFTQFARAAAQKHPDIHLKTIEELHEDILQIRPYLHNAVRRYEQDSRFFDFIPPYGSLPAHEEESSTGSRLMEEIVKAWLTDKTHQQLCLFGDFGIGKTTFLEFLHYSFAKRYLADVAFRIPLLIPLRRHYETADHEELISHFFRI